MEHILIHTNPVSQMTSDQSGSILPKPEYIWLYLTCYFSFLLFFTLLGIFNGFFIPWLVPWKYEKKNEIQ